MSEITREQTLKELQVAEDELERIEERIAALRDKLGQTNANGVGVMVSYDYDIGWIIETLNDGEWEIYSDHTRFSEAAHDGRMLAKTLGCGVEINSYKPKREKVA